MINSHFFRWLDLFFPAVTLDAELILARVTLTATSDILVPSLVELVPMIWFNECSNYEVVTINKIVLKVKLRREWNERMKKEWRKKIVMKGKQVCARIVPLSTLSTEVGCRRTSCMMKRMSSRVWIRGNERPSNGSRSLEHFFKRRSLEHFLKRRSLE